MSNRFATGFSLSDFCDLMLGEDWLAAHTNTRPFGSLSTFTCPSFDQFSLEFGQPT